MPEVAEDQEAARALVSLGLQMNDAFARQVAEALLRRFFPASAVELVGPGITQTP